MEESAFNQGLLNFLKASPTPFHAVAQLADMSEKAGFARVSESDTWNLKKGQGYYVTRNDSAIIVFTTGISDLAETGIRMTCAHTDSPCLKVKPQPEIVSRSYLQLGVEVYGGALLNTWFDRDLSLAGRITYLSEKKIIRSALIDFKYPLAFIPSLAIHFNRDANKNHTVNEQKDLPPVLAQVSGNEMPDFRALLLQQLKKEHPDCDADTVLEYELSFYDTQPPSFVGLNQEFIAAARLDNLLSCYTGLTSLAESDKQTPCLLVFNDHEETGSVSVAGAQGNFLESVLTRLCPCAENLSRTLARSVMISADNAHGVHPNYADKYDERHGPILNRGPVIKINAQQRYASDSETSALFRYLCQQAEVPVQSFVMRSDMGCGSTVGPLTAAKIGVKTVDVGVPTFGMHSVRELSGVKDAFYLYRVLKKFFDVTNRKDINRQ